jgi:tRNA A58 N-methylase Trm61
MEIGENIFFRRSHTAITDIMCGMDKNGLYIDHMERDERISGMHINQIIETLNLKPGLKIADIGAGSGLFSREMAKRVD